jgi:hypothetical protein
MIAERSNHSAAWKAEVAVTMNARKFDENTNDLLYLNL